MRVNLFAETSFSPATGKTQFEVRAYVHEDDEPMRTGLLYEEVCFAQQPTEDMNLNLWATAILRGLAARMEETFVYVDNRPPAVLTKTLQERK